MYTLSSALDANVFLENIPTNCYCRYLSNNVDVRLLEILCRRYLCRYEYYNIITESTSAASSGGSFLSLSRTNWKCHLVIMGYVPNPLPPCNNRVRTSTSPPEDLLIIWAKLYMWPKHTPKSFVWNNDIKLNKHFSGFRSIRRSAEHRRTRLRTRLPSCVVCAADTRWWTCHVDRPWHFMDRSVFIYLNIYTVT